MRFLTAFGISMALAFSALAADKAPAGEHACNCSDKCEGAKGGKCTCDDCKCEGGCKGGTCARCGHHKDGKKGCGCDHAKK